MARASATNPITLIIDGSALISGLFIAGRWLLEHRWAGLRHGVFSKAAPTTTASIMADPNGAVPINPGPPAPVRGSSVALRNFTLTATKDVGVTEISTTGTRQGRRGLWYFGINLMNLNDIVIENVVVVNTPAYHIRLWNVRNVEVSGCVLRSVGTNTDGLHFDGAANDISISNCEFFCGDDAIALNCPEGYTAILACRRFKLQIQ